MPLPPYWRWSAAELAAAIRRRDVSSREAVLSVFERLAEVNARLNAVVDVLYDDALAAADAADARLRAGEAVGPLHGLPVTIKIDTDYAGRATTRGVVAYRDRVAASDAPAVAAWRRAGAVIVGRTNVPAFTARYFTDNDLHGRTLNPWRRDATPGGSSGGAAVATAVGIGALAHGTDRSGSVRYPAYANGVYGLRPSVGRVAMLHGSAGASAGIGSQITGVAGLLARRAADLRPGLAAMIAADPRDPWHTPAPLDGWPGLPRRVALAAPVAGYDIDPEVTAALLAAATALRAAGYEVETVALPRFEELARLFRQLVAAEETLDRSAAIERDGDAAVRTARRNARGSEPALDFDGYRQGFGRRLEIAREWNALLEDFPLLLLPVSFRRPVPVDHDQADAAQMLAFLRAQHPLLAVTALGLPALAVPTAAVDGLPTGVQLVSRRFREDLLIEAGEAIEASIAPATPIGIRW